MSFIGDMPIQGVETLGNQVSKGEKGVGTGRTESRRSGSWGPNNNGYIGTY